jgi:hypothetical protein
MSPVTPLAMPILSLNGSSPPSIGSRTTLALDVSYLNLATTRFVRSSTAIIESSTAYEMTSSRSRPCFMVPVCSDLSESADIRASNFPMNPPAASRCSAAARYRER